MWGGVGEGTRAKCGAVRTDIVSDGTRTGGRDVGRAAGGDATHARSDGVESAARRAGTRAGVGGNGRASGGERTRMESVKEHGGDGRRGCLRLAKDGCCGRKTRGRRHL